jgi:gamma-glutamylcysteine synthetase
MFLMYLYHFQYFFQRIFFKNLLSMRSVINAPFELMLMLPLFLLKKTKI